MSGDRAFLDSNVLIYLFSEDDLEKKNSARDVLDNYDSVVSTQVINEISNVLTKKMKMPISAVKQFVKDVFTVSEVKQVNRKTVFLALDLMNRYGYSYYDCLILSSALESGCEFLFSEDMSDGQIIEGKLKIKNPFQTQ